MFLAAFCVGWTESLHLYIILHHYIFFFYDWSFLHVLNLTDNLLLSTLFLAQVSATMSSFTGIHYTYYFTYKTAKIIKRKLSQVSVLCKTAAFEQQISKFYLQILNMEASF